MSEDKPATPIQDMDAFAGLIANWFNNCHEQLKHVQTLPNDVTTKILFEGKEVELTSREKEAMRQGASIAAEIFKELPFEAIEVNENATSENSRL